MISPPTGSAIEVDVINGNSEGVSGVTAQATFMPVESGSPTTASKAPPAAPAASC